MSMENKTVLITGANRGIGRTLVNEALRRGAKRVIFDGLENNEEDIFPDPLSQSIAEGWRTGVAKAFGRQYAGFVPESAAL
jgi:NAD(P)-dependent dehydrogenase (short-subunit alcohol dehydrogenase family)